MFKSCSIYRKPQGFYLFAYMRTDYGGVSRPPVTKLSSSATASELGDAVLRILSELSGQITDVNLGEAMAAFRAYLKESGFKNVAAFEKKACVTSVEFDGEFYKVVSNQKNEHDINVATGSKKLPPAANAEELGNAILAAFGNTL